MNAGAVFAYATIGLLVAAVVYTRVVRSRRTPGVGLYKAEIIGGWLGIGTLAVVGGVLAANGSSQRDHVGGVFLLLGGLVSLGAGIYSGWWLRGGK